MNISYLAILFLLISVVLIYSYVGLKFTKDKKSSKLYFILGLFIGMIGGFIVFYVLHTTKGASSFKSLLSWWRLVTTLSIIVGGLIILLIYSKFIKK